MFLLVTIWLTICDHTAIEFYNKKHSIEEMFPLTTCE